MKTNKAYPVGRKRAAGGGRKPRGAFRGKSAVLTTRITPGTRKALESAAASSGRSLSQEVETRLRQSLEPHYAREGHIKALGELTKLLTEEIERLTGANWLTDRFTAEAVRYGVDYVLSHFAPQPKENFPVPAKLQQMAAELPGEMGEVYRRPEGIASMEALRQIALIEKAPQFDSKGRFNVPLLGEWDDPFNPERPFRRWQLFQNLGLGKDERK